MSRVNIDQIKISSTNGIGSPAFAFKQQVDLIGDRDGVNMVFMTPSPDKFIQGIFETNIFKISVIHNGALLMEGIDYLVSESGGVSTGYDTVTIISFIPIVDSTMTANYVIVV